VTEPAQVKSYHQQMLKESVFLQRLVSDLLDLSKLQNTDFKFEMEEVCLSELLSDCARSARHIAQEKNVEIQLDFDTAMTAVNGDYGRLRQMFLIILDNAVKFSPAENKVMITLRDKTVTIRDYGRGIAREDLPYIFDRFYKVKSEENLNGTGLGLAIAKQIADRHNVKVTVDSQLGEGTAFGFVF
jgi:signal transduction histidine kinase